MALFVGNISKTCTSDEFKRAFEEIADCRINLKVK